MTDLTEQQTYKLIAAVCGLRIFVRMLHKLGIPKEITDSYELGINQVASIIAKLPHYEKSSAEFKELMKNFPIIVGKSDIMLMDYSDKPFPEIVKTDEQYAMATLKMAGEMYLDAMDQLENIQFDCAPFIAATESLRALIKAYFDGKNNMEKLGKVIDGLGLDGSAPEN